MSFFRDDDIFSLDDPELEPERRLSLAKTVDSSPKLKGRLEVFRRLRGALSKLGQPKHSREFTETVMARLGQAPKRSVLVNGERYSILKQWVIPELGIAFAVAMLFVQGYKPDENASAQILLAQYSDLAAGLDLSQDAPGVDDMLAFTLEEL